MSDPLPYARRGAHAAPAERRRRASRLPLVLLMAGSLVAASLLRGSIVKAYGPKNDAVAAGGASLGQFNSYTLGLLLGGLRGPLVMTLWSTSETQKGERNLDDINTKIELIGLLQPEFDAVHLFQIWNKAYNLSVQMSNLASKYSTILDALNYAEGRRANGANINIESAVASIWFDKLGNSQEKAYYRTRIRDESRKPLSQTKFVFPESRRDEFVRAALAAGADGRRYSIRPESNTTDRLSARLSDEYAEAIRKTFTGADVTTTTIPARDPSRQLRTSFLNATPPVLGGDGKLLESFANHTLPEPDIADTKWLGDEYGELFYLRRFEPYPYGLSPFAYGYNYYKRSLALQVDKKQTHAQLSDRVLSSRPALALKAWAEEEIELGRRAELAQFGLKPLPDEGLGLPLEMPATAVPIDRTPLTPLLREAIYSYARAGELGEFAIAEFKAHVARSPDDASQYRDKIADVLTRGALARADSLYLRAITADSDAGRLDLARQAAAEYEAAIGLAHRNILAFFVPDDVIRATFPQGYGKLDAINSFENPALFPADQLEATVRRAIQFMTQNPQYMNPDVGEYATYASRAHARLERLAPLLK